MGSIAAGLTSSGAIWEAFAQAGIRVLHSPDDLGRTYDYLVIGAGSAGCVLARRLAEAGRSVTVAGSWRSGDTPCHLGAARLASASGQLG